MEFGKLTSAVFRQYASVFRIQLADNVFGENDDSFSFVTEIEANGARIATVTFADNKSTLLQSSHELGYVDSLQTCVLGELSLTGPLPRPHETME